MFYFVRTDPKIITQDMSQNAKIAFNFLPRLSLLLATCYLLVASAVSDHMKIHDRVK